RGTRQVGCQCTFLEPPACHVNAISLPPAGEELTRAQSVLVTEADGRRYIILMMQTVLELQLDGLVGPTHHFGGLSFGNRASMTHAGWHSRPRQAARQGLAKMRQVCALGVPQAVLPPLPRPDVGFLRQVGF